mmetsp:Transcript_44451/g.135482  ORF Transcript_44451/g.135482 Transcript_44451/m.135482 type:complete len:164 (+) Transcript_44451:959-1450(+)
MICTLILKRFIFLVLIIRQPMVWNRLKQMEESLRDLLDRQGQGLDRLVATVKQNNRVQKRMKIYLKAAALQEVVTMVLRSDVDRNSTFDDDEIDLLVLRMQEHPDLKHMDAKVLKKKLTRGNRTIFTVLGKANDIYNSGASGTLTASVAPRSWGGGDIKRSVV